MRLRRLREAGELVTRIRSNRLASQAKSVAERKALRDAIHVGLVNEFRAAQSAAALRAFALAQVAAAGAGAQDLAARRDFEALGHRFLGLDTFGTSHKFNFLPKERAI